MLRGQNLAEDISIHAPRVGSDPSQISASYLVYGFQSTLPVWGATVAAGIVDGVKLKISIHAPRVGSDRVYALLFKTSEISIHAPRVGSDKSIQRKSLFQYYFNPRSPCGERLRSCVFLHFRDVFQSTLPVWGATDYQQDRLDRALFQSTLPVWGATPLSSVQCPTSDISIHAPRVGSDTNSAILVSPFKISIHAPRVGSDEPVPGGVPGHRDFNPRSPCGERQFPSWLIRPPLDFNPRSPCGERPSAWR